MAEGEIASKPDPKTGAAKPMNAVYEVIIPVDNPNLVLQPGLRGFAKIDGGTYTLGLVAGAVVEQGVQLPALIRDREREPCRAELSRRSARHHLDRHGAASSLGAVFRDVPGPQRSPFVGDPDRRAGEGVCGGRRRADAAGCVTGTSVHRRAAR